MEGVGLFLSHDMHLQYIGFACLLPTSTPLSVTPTPSSHPSPSFHPALSLTPPLLSPCPPSPLYPLVQAYTSQFLSLVMFALMMSEDSISKLPRRHAIIKAMGQLPGELP